MHLQVSSGLAVFGGVRVALGPARALSTTAARLVDPTENPWAPELAELTTTLGTQELELQLQFDPATIDGQWQQAPAALQCPEWPLHQRHLDEG